MENNNSKRVHALPCFVLIVYSTLNPTFEWMNKWPFLWLACCITVDEYNNNSLSTIYCPYATYRRMFNWMLIKIGSVNNVHWVGYFFDASCNKWYSYDVIQNAIIHNVYGYYHSSSDYTKRAPIAKPTRSSAIILNTVWWRHRGKGTSELIL